MTFCTATGGTKSNLDHCGFLNTVLFCVFREKIQNNCDFLTPITRTFLSEAKYHYLHPSTLSGTLMLIKAIQNRGSELNLHIIFCMSNCRCGRVSEAQSLRCQCILYQLCRELHLQLQRRIRRKPLRRSEYLKFVFIFVCMKYRCFSNHFERNVTQNRSQMNGTKIRLQELLSTN